MFECDRKNWRNIMEAEEELSLIDIKVAAGKCKCFVTICQFM